MGATFTYAVRYWVTARCETPLRTAPADGGTETVLTGADGRLLLQGSSIAGALRGWLETQEGGARADALFGSPDHAGQLIVSDGVFDKTVVPGLRPRLRIDDVTGTAADGGKFDLAQINAGAAFTFSLTWLGHREEREERTACVERLLAALHGGEITLGGQKSNGFGRVTLEARRQCCDLYQQAGRTRWLDDREDGEPLPLSPREPAGQAVFTVTGQADSILVKASAARQTQKGSCTVPLEEEGVPILPGSSVKGAVRARAKLILQASGRPEALLEELFGRGARENDNGAAGRVRFEDVRLADGQRREITRIRVSRFTGGVMRGGLFTEEPLCSPVGLRISAPAEQKCGCALLLYALRDLGCGLYNLGSGGAQGRGYLRVGRIDVSAEGKRASLCFRDGRAERLEDPDGLVEDWLAAWKEAAE